MTLVLFVLLIAAIVLVILGSHAIDLITGRLHIDFMTHVLLTILRYLVVILILYTGISFIYKYGPAQRKRSRFLLTRCHDGNAILYYQHHGLRLFLLIITVRIINCTGPSVPSLWQWYGCKSYVS